MRRILVLAFLAACGPHHGGGPDAVSCGDGQIACDGVCVVADSCDFSVTSVDPANGFQNGGEWLTVHGHGFAAGMRVLLGDGRAPTLVIDATSARIQAPPGPVGNVDITIRSGATDATLPGGYRYQQAGLETPWQAISMEVLRGEDPGLAVLQDGHVLIAGGTTVPDQTANSLDSFDLFDRPSETVSPVPTATMGTVRWQDAAVTLLTGNVLIVGGACHANNTNCVGDPAVADLYDPATGTSRPTAGGLAAACDYPRAVLLPDGRVLISCANDPSLQIYDPAADSFSSITATQSHIFSAMVRLRDGRALLLGGDGGVTAAELFDPDSDTLTSTGTLNQGRSMFTAHTLPDGRVAAIGGSSVSAGAINTPLASIELYDPAAGTWSVAPYALTIGRTWHASALVRDGTVLAMGGYTLDGDCASSVGTVDQIDFVAGTVTPFAALPDGKRATEWNAVTLLDGSIVAVGGGACGTAMALPEVYFLPGAPVQ
jgi:hypothetical protein